MTSVASSPWNSLAKLVNERSAINNPQARMNHRDMGVIRAYRASGAQVHAAILLMMHAPLARHRQSES